MELLQVPVGAFENPLEVLAYVGLGLAWAAAGYLRKVLSGEKTFRPRKFASTLLIGLVAGIVVAFTGGGATESAYTEAAAIAIPIVDRFFNQFVSAAYGGSKGEEVRAV